MALLGLIGLGLTLLNPAEKLIDQLLVIDEAYPISSLGFLALNQTPSASSAMVGLVRMGVPALPTLFAHLDDARETKYVASDVIWFWDAYDDRFPGHNPQLNSFAKRLEWNEPLDTIPDHRYVVKVGDLCHVLIGQIVNRRQEVLIENAFAINSIFHTPALAKALRKDWEGLTVDQHRKQLEIDLSWRTDSAIQRLLYYYPTEGEKQALRCLNRPLYARDQLWTLMQKLLKTNDAAEWRRIAKESKERFGSEGFTLLADSLYTSNRDKTLAGGNPEQADRILEVISPGYKPHQPKFYNLATLPEQIYLVDALKPFPNAKFDAAIQAMLRRAIAWHKGTKHEEPCGIETLIQRCAERKIKP